MLAYQLIFPIIIIFFRLRYHMNFRIEKPKFLALVRLLDKDSRAIFRILLHHAQPTIDHAQTHSMKLQDIGNLWQSGANCLLIRKALHNIHTAIEYTFDDSTDDRWGVCAVFCKTSFDEDTFEYAYTQRFKDLLANQDVYKFLAAHNLVSESHDHLHASFTAHSSCPS